MITTEKQEYYIFYNSITKKIYGDTIVNFTRSDRSVGSELRLSFSGGELGSFHILSGDTFIDLSRDVEIDSIPNFPYEDKTFEGIFYHASSMQNTSVGRFIIHLKMGREYLSISPLEILFRINKNAYAPLEQSLDFINLRTDDVLVSVPDFLDLEYNPSEKISTIKVKTKEQIQNLNENYQGTLTISNGTEQIQVALKVEFFRSVVSDFLPNEKVFCLDKKILTIQKTAENGKYARISLGFSVQGEAFSSVYVVPFFRGEVMFDAGEKIHQYAMATLMKNLDFNTENPLYFPPITAEISVEELDKDYQILHKTTLSNTDFYPGKKPKMYPLFTHHDVRRRVENSVILVGFDNEEFNFNHLPKLNKNNVNAGKKGIVVEQLTAENSLFAKVQNVGHLKIITMPKTGESIGVKWLNQNGVLEWITFSGEWKSEIVAKNTIRKSVFRNENKKFDSSIDETLKINTGYIFRTEIELIKELMQSPICQIIIGEKSFVCIPDTEKITAEDSTRELIAFELEFLVKD